MWFTASLDLTICFKNGLIVYKKGHVGVCLDLTICFKNDVTGGGVGRILGV